MSSTEDETTLHYVVWRGITLSMQYRTHEGHHTFFHRMDFEAVEPANAPFPNYGYVTWGPVIDDLHAYAVKLLDDAAEKPDWKAYEASTRQMTLF